MILSKQSLKTVTNILQILQVVKLTLLLWEENVSRVPAY